MKFNTKTRYGLRTMLELALNEHNEEGIFQKDIAENQDVSVKYLDHIISALKAAQLIENVGGKKSGYQLTRPAKNITVYDIYAAFEEDLAVIDCLVTDSHCPKKKYCVMRDYWDELNDVIRNNMQQQTIADLASDQSKAEGI